MKVYKHKNDGKYYSLLDKTKEHLFVAPIYIDYAAYVDRGETVITTDYENISAWSVDDLDKYFEKKQ